MALFRIPIIGFGALPDTSGNVYQEPAAINLESNDRYPNLPYAFPDTGTLLKLGVQFPVPQNYNASAGITPKIVMTMVTVATTGNWVQRVDYTSIADGESWDPSSDQETVSATITVPGTARLMKNVEIALTTANLLAGDMWKGVLCRDGSSGSDTLAATIYLVGASLLYSDT